MTGGRCCRYRVLWKPVTGGGFSAGLIGLRIFPSPCWAGSTVTTGTIVRAGGRNPLPARLRPALPARALASNAPFPFNLPCAATLSALAPVLGHHNEEHAAAPSRKWGTDPRTACLSNGG